MKRKQVKRPSSRRTPPRHLYTVTRSAKVLPVIVTGEDSISMALGIPISPEMARAMAVGVAGGKALAATPPGYEPFAVYVESRRIGGRRRVRESAK